ncbi:MAG: hypothetical protein JW809_18145 [Pirellulales bacterium]|nr:hypothetical protein [Pirellulales bacterium]
MRVLPVLTIAASLSGLAHPALAQFGMYGAPEMLRLPRTQPQAATPYGYAQPSGAYPAPAAPQYAPQYAPPAAQPGVQGPVIPATSVAPAPRVFPGSQPMQPPVAPIAQPDTAYDPAPGYAPSDGDNRYVYTPAAAPVEAAPPLQPRPEQPNLVSQVMDENRDGSCGYVGSCADSCAPQCATGCELCCPSPWYASASYLHMGRNQANRLWTTYNTARLDQQLGNSQIGLSWQSGGEVRFGRRFCCDEWAVEATYWTLNAMTGSSHFNVPGGTVSTPLDVFYVRFLNDADTCNLYFDNAAEHRLWRRDEFHNVEINLVRRGLNYDPDGAWNVDWLVGARFFRFEDDFRFGTLQDGATWGGNGGADEAYLRENIKNNLVGFQFGFDARSNTWHNLRLFVAPQLGIYNNHIENRFELYRGDGINARPTAASHVPGTFPVQSSKNVVAFLAEIDLGLDWQISRRWAARVGYRVLAATGMGLAEEQIPFYIVDIPEIRDIDYNGDLIVHGAFAGLTYNF